MVLKQRCWFDDFCNDAGAQRRKLDVFALLDAFAMIGTEMKSHRLTRYAESKGAELFLLLLWHSEWLPL